MFWRKRQPVVNPRRNKRMQADYLMTYQESSKKNEAPYAANVKDVSATGTRFLTEQFYTEGTDLDIQIMIPPLQKAINTRGRVVRIRPTESSEGLYYVSVRFQSLEPRDAQLLDEFIESIAAKKGARFMVDQSKEHWRKSAFMERING